MISKLEPVKEDNLEIKSVGAMEERDVNLNSEVPLLLLICSTRFFSRLSITKHTTTILPPNVFQGYKFNILYPDFVDKIKAPI